MPYSKNFLTQVIARVDYLPLLILDTEQPSQFQERVRSEYPRLESLKGIGIEVPKKMDSPISIDRAPVVWKFNDREQVNTIDLSSKYFALVTSRYERFSTFLERLTLVYNHFVEIYKPSIINRIGLRYINEVKIDGNPFDWQGLINDNLFATLNAFPNIKTSITRSMHQLHFRGENNKIVFQFGLYNSEFPNPVAQRAFILDYDCVSEDEHEPHQVLPIFTSFNTKIYTLFEQSISDNLKGIMNGV